MSKFKAITKLMITGVFSWAVFMFSIELMFKLIAIIAIITGLAWLNTPIFTYLAIIIALGVIIVLAGRSKWISSIYQALK